MMACAATARRTQESRRRLNDEYSLHPLPSPSDREQDLSAIQRMSMTPVDSRSFSPAKESAKQSNARAICRGAWRLSRALSNFRTWQVPAIPGTFFRYFSDWRLFQRAGGTALFTDLAPCLFDTDPRSQSGGGHYFYQDVWALRHLGAIRPTVHHDFGSRLDGFVAQATAICPVVYWDIRPPHFHLPGLEFREADITDVPLEDGSAASISCLHVAEHIGLGRYGDPIDPLGTEKAITELQRALAPGGVLLFSMPVGRERVEFNAQRIWNPLRVIDLLGKMELVEFSAVTDNNEFLQFIDPGSVANAKYACGLYRLIRS